MRFIDADLTLKLMLEWADREKSDECRRGYHDCMVIVNDMPTTVVTCKECVHWRRSGQKRFQKYCFKYDQVTTADDFCSFAERKEDE